MISNMLEVGAVHPQGGITRIFAEKHTAMGLAALLSLGPYFREFSQNFNGKTYGLVVDGDFHMVYYRSGVLKDLGMEPPKTWDD